MQKPHIWYYPAVGMWVCTGEGLNSLAYTPISAYERWSKFKIAMERI